MNIHDPYIQGVDILLSPRNHWMSLSGALKSFMVIWSFGVLVLLPR